VGLERTVRLPGKRDLDQQLGAAGIATARVGRGEALHEAGRSLLAMWFDWLREESAVVQWRHQRDNLMQQARVLGRRVELGDAPRLERLQADAALAQAAAQLSQAEGRARVAAERLRRHHPLIALPVAVPEMPPDAVEGRADEWIETIVQHNHELGVARAESARARIIASRSDAERLPRPQFRHPPEPGAERRGAPAWDQSQRPPAR
jgi:cobalt-zinc-cadmium efflux system outer membrane protein